VISKPLTDVSVNAAAGHRIESSVAATDKHIAITKLPMQFHNSICKQVVIAFGVH